jgi:hypothetical protein
VSARVPLYEKAATMMSRASRAPVTSSALPEKVQSKRFIAMTPA